MMYNQKLVASLKANGKILREFKDTVYIPFGSEYAIAIKNLHTTRCVVNVFIDGDDVVPGGLVLNAGQSIDLERSVKGGNLTEGNRFKFIERTGAVEAHRGTKLEDGLIRIEYQYEKHPLHDWFTLNRGINNHSTFRDNTIYSKSSEYTGVTDKFSVTASGATYSSNGSVSQMNVNGAMRGVDYSKGEAMKASAAAAINQVAPQSIADLHDSSATMDWMDLHNDVGIVIGQR